MTQLKLIAFDEDDLNVVSAHLQDAIVRPSDLAYLVREKRFAAVCDRYDWAGLHASPASRAKASRRRAALRFERVLAARRTGFRPGAGEDQPLVLLAVTFSRKAPEDPAGTVTLTFAGKAALQLDVECIEAELRDLGPAWGTKSRPKHPLDDPAGA